MSVQIVTNRSEIEPYTEAIQAGGDSERNSFGFLRPDAYKEFVLQRRAIIALDDETGELTGHCLYGGVCPQAKVFQTYVAPQYRGQGVGARLLESLFGRLEKNGYLSVIANVASDLEAANRFYQKHEFEIIKTKAGGQSRKRTINVRSRDLKTPSLLELFERPSDQGLGISFRPPLQSQPPLYILDLNVIFDVTRRRPRTEIAQGVIAAGMENGVRLTITTELIAELERHSPADRPDPILGLCKSLPRLKMPSASELTRYREILLPIVFSEKAEKGNLSKNDEADLRHLSTAIIESAKGFVTSDSAILNASAELESRFGLDILSPSTFGQGFAVEFDDKISTFVATKNATIERSSFADSDVEALHDLLSGFYLGDKISRQVTAAGTAHSPRRREIVRSGNQLIAFASWDAPQARSCERMVSIFANEGHADASFVIRNLLETVCRDIGRQSVSLFRLKPQVQQHLVRSTAIALGFHADGQASPRHPTLRKACLGRIVLPDHWDGTRREIEDAIGLKIEGSFSFDDTSEIVITDAGGFKRVVGLRELEDLLSPAIFCADDRGGVLFPIRPGYAEELFRGSQQPSFLDQKSAVLKQTKAYIGGSYSSVPEGGLAFFYESSNQGGRKAVIAVARVLKRYAAPKDEAKKISSDRGVISDRSIDDARGSQLQTVTDIDSIMLFENPIGLSELRRIGCWDEANLVTSKLIQPAHCASLIRAGVPKLG